MIPFWIKLIIGGIAAIGVMFAIREFRRTAEQKGREQESKERAEAHLEEIHDSQKFREAIKHTDPDIARQRMLDRLSKQKAD